MVTLLSLSQDMWFSCASVPICCKAEGEAGAHWKEEVLHVLNYAGENNTSYTNNDKSNITTLVLIQISVVDSFFI